MIKKALSALLVVLALVPALSGCKPSGTESDRLSVVTTAFPEYDWVMNILGDRSDDIDVTMLLDGVDIHSYLPSAADIVKISDCDLFIYTGGESDGWAGDALKEAKNENMKVISLMQSLGNGVKKLEFAEGMEKEDGDEYDEHVWLSLKNAKTLCGAIKDALCRLDSDYADLYAANAESYISRLSALDERYGAAVAAAKRNTLLFCDRFPFLYLVNDYGLCYYAAFAGCSAETEASFETVAFLAKKTDELALSAVLILDGSDGRLARTVVDSTADKSARILSIDSMQSVSKNDIKNGASYLDIMENNLDVIKQALS